MTNSFLILQDVSNVRRMGAVFNNADSFSQPIGSWVRWIIRNSSCCVLFCLCIAESHIPFRTPQQYCQQDVSSVTVMEFMFAFNSVFDEDLSAWDVSSVTTMASMFQDAEAFDQDLSAWDVSALNNMEQMFFQAESFDQDLCAWGAKFPNDAVQVDSAFSVTACENTSDPNLSATPPGPLCANCS